MFLSSFKPILWTVSEKYSVYQYSTKHIPNVTWYPGIGFRITPSSTIWSPHSKCMTIWQQPNETQRSHGGVDKLRGHSQVHAANLSSIWPQGHALCASVCHLRIPKNRRHGFAIFRGDRSKKFNQLRKLELIWNDLDQPGASVAFGLRTAFAVVLSTRTWPTTVGTTARPGDPDDGR